MSSLSQPFDVTVVKRGESPEDLARRRYREAISLGIPEATARYLADPDNRFSLSDDAKVG